MLDHPPGPWTTTGRATASDGRPVTVVEDLTRPDAPMAFVDAEGTWTVLERRLEPTTDARHAYFGGHPVDEVLTSQADLLGRELLEGAGDPDPASVATMLPPVEGMPTWSFLGSPHTGDTLAVHADGRTPTVDAAQVLPRIADARAEGRVLAGLVGGWLPALRLVYPDGPDRPDAWCEHVLFAPVHPTRKHPVVQQVWHRISRIEGGVVTSRTCLDTYPAVHPRGAADADDLHTALLAFHDDWQTLLGTVTRIDLPDQRLADLARHGLARAMMTRTRGLPRYGVVDRDYGGPEHDGFQDTFTVELAAATDWGLSEHARTVLDTYLDHYVRDDGSLEYRGPATGQYGRMLTAIAHYVRCTGDTDALLRHRARIDAVADLLLDRRRTAAALPADDPGHGLLSGWCEADSALEADPDRYLVPYVSSSAEAVRGLTDLGLAWREIAAGVGDEPSARADALAREAGLLSDDLRRALDRDLRTDLDPPWLPVVAGATTPWHEAVADDMFDPQFRAYRANAELLHSGCLTLAQVETVVRYREEHGDVVLGVPCAYGLSRDPGLTGNKELAGFLAHGHFHGLLQHDKVREFLLGLWTLVSHHHTRGSWTAPETRRVRPGSPAAPYCSPAQLAVPAMVRWMLVFEQPVADELWLARALPRDWLAHGQRLSVESAPTRWGPVGYAVQSRLDDGRLEATVTLPPTAPDDTWLRLRLPLGRRLTAAELDGQPVEVDAAREAVRVSAAGQASGPAHLVVTTGPDDAWGAGPQT